MEKISRVSMNLLVASLWVMIPVVTLILVIDWCIISSSVSDIIINCWGTKYDEVYKFENRDSMSGMRFCAYLSVVKFNEFNSRYIITE